MQSVLVAIIYTCTWQQKLKKHPTVDYLDQSLTVKDNPSKRRLRFSPGSFKWLFTNIFKVVLSTIVFLKVLLFNVLKNPYFWHPRYISSSFPWENSKNHCYYMYHKKSAMLTRFKCIITDQKELIFRSSMTTWKQKFLQCFIAGNRCSSLNLSLRDWRPRNVLIQV